MLRRGQLLSPFDRTLARIQFVRRSACSCVRFNPANRACIASTIPSAAPALPARTVCRDFRPARYPFPSAVVTVINLAQRFAHFPLTSLSCAFLRDSISVTRSAAIRSSSIASFHCRSQQSSQWTLPVPLHVRQKHSHRFSLSISTCVHCTQTVRIVHIQIRQKLWARGYTFLDPPGLRGCLDHSAIPSCPGWPASSDVPCPSVVVTVT